MFDSPDPKPRRPEAPESPLGSEAAELLKEANQAYKESLAEPRAWLALSERRNGRSSWWMHGGFALAGAAALVWLSKGASEPSPEGELRPEPAPLLASVVKPEPQPPAQPSVVQQSLRQSENETLPELRRPRASTQGPVSESRCRSLVQERRYEEAAMCFERLAKGGGLDADVAQLERARLAIHQLADPARGLEVLDRYRETLAASALRGEAAELRVHALFALGKNEQALSESEAVLGSPWGPDAASELRWLRGRIYEERLGDCNRAIDEYLWDPLESTCRHASLSIL